MNQTETKEEIFRLAQTAWPEMNEKNVLRLMANERLSKENARLESEIAQLREQATGKVAILEADAAQSVPKISQGPLIAKLQSRVAELEAQNEQLHHDIERLDAALRAEPDRWRLAEIHSRNAGLRFHVASLEAENERLKADAAQDKGESSYGALNAKIASLETELVTLRAMEVNK